MALAYSSQKIQDWLTQQWVIWRGKKINPEKQAWLMGPFGQVSGIGEKFIDQLAAQEGLMIEENQASAGLIPSIKSLNLAPDDLAGLSPLVIEFYEKTSDFELEFSVHWHPFFKPFGGALQKLFSRRIKQLNIPTQNIKKNELISSKIIKLIDPISKEIKYSIWLRSIVSSGEIIYSGVYGVSRLACGSSCIKAVFPLPKGNATVIMLARVGSQGELILEASGKQFGDAGFYFLVEDKQANFWSKYIKSFTDTLIINSCEDHLEAKQVLKLWGLKVLAFEYKCYYKPTDKPKKS